MLVVFSQGKLVFHVDRLDLSHLEGGYWRQLVNGEIVLDLILVLGRHLRVILLHLHFGGLSAITS